MFKPAAGRYLVQLDEEKVSKGGIYLPETHKDTRRTRTGKVVAAGAPALHQSGNIQHCEFAKGDVVRFSAYAGADFDEDAKKYVVIAEADVMGVHQ